MLVKSQRAQPGDDDVLQVTLPRVNHIEHAIRMAKRRRAAFAAFYATGPNFVAACVGVKALVVEVLTQQARISKAGRQYLFPRR